MKNLFDAQSEEPSGPEGERQARIELARLDGVDGVPGHIKGVGQLGLRPVTLGAQRRNRKLSYQGPTPPLPGEGYHFAFGLPRFLRIESRSRSSGIPRDAQHVEVIVAVAKS